MGKITSLIEFKGRVGNVVGSKGRDGKMILRQAAASVNNPKTQKQTAQRARFLGAITAANNIPIEAIAGLRPLAASRNISVRNLYVSLLLKRAIIPKYPQIVDGEATYVALPEDIIFSEGNQPNFRASTPLSPENPENIIVTVGRNNLPLGSVVHVVAYSFDRQVWKHVTAIVNADEITVTVPVSMAEAGKWSVYVYSQVLRGEGVDVDYYGDPYAGTTIDRELLESNSSYSETTFIGTVNLL